jgi:hypothetical protein
MTAATQVGHVAGDVLVETSRALPLVSFSIALKTGSILDPEGMSGATRMLTRWMRRTAGGREAQVIDTEIDALGGAFGADVSPSTLIFQGTVITTSWRAPASQKRSSKGCGARRWPSSPKPSMTIAVSADVGSVTGSLGRTLTHAP